VPKLDLTYPNILDLFPEHLDPKRTDSAAFLIWYLENYLRLDAVEAVDAVCDQSGDKGVDGIYINEDANTVDVYQSRISQKKTSSTGDKTLREFAGTLKQFETPKSVADLQRSAGKADVARLIERLDLANKIDDYELKGVFVSNTELDANGEDYLRSHSGIRFIGRQELINTFISSDRDTKVPKPLRFDISGHEASTYVVDKTNKAVIAPLKAAELIRMDGISNQALFALNVRGPLGKTQVNRDIAKSVQDKKRHKLFPLFHNGITIIADKVQTTDDDIRIENYYVVNGCQSLSELYKNRAHITDNLRVLVKLIEIDASSDLSETVTIFSNNQNGVKARDFKSNNPIQIRLQNEIRSQYGKEFHYEIKRGEDNAGKKTITNELAGLYLLAFDLKRPWDTHRKYQIFEDEHAVVFGRPAVDAHRIILCALLAERVSAAIQKLDNSLFAKYVLTRFLILYILRLILEDDPLGKKLIADPSQYVSDEKMRAALLAALDKVLNDVVIDLNAELAQVGEDFDYRGKLRDEVWVKALAHHILADHAKLVARGRIDSFERDFETASKEKPKLRFLKRKK
jgi:AIPR protein